MRHLLILPGNSTKNKDWGILIAKHYGSAFATTTLVTYEHWESGEATIDFAREEHRLAELAAALPPETDLTIFAKSAGSLLAMQACYHEWLRPSRCVFFGMPLDWAEAEVWQPSLAPLAALTVPTIAFHNEADPTARYTETVRLLALYASRITLVTTHEADHWYGDTDTYDQVLADALFV